MPDDIEVTSSSDPYLDFCLWAYDPPSIINEPWRSANLLYDSFLEASAPDEAYQLCSLLRENIGEWKTVWGVKQFDGQVSWEFYFYDYQRLEREVSLKRVLDSISQILPCRLSINEDSLYFMFSIDFDVQQLSLQQEMEEVNIYLGNLSESVSSGICYSLSDQGLLLDNLYYFFDAQQEKQTIVDKITSSMYLQCSQINYDDILIPELRDCRTIVVANKKNRDGIYFSGITVEQLLYFLKLMQYPDSMISYLEKNQNHYEHLLFDIGIDYIMQDGEICYTKSSYYGVF